MTRARVIKIGGRAQSVPALVAALARVATRSSLCIVHGGGDEVSALQRRLGSSPRFHAGRRVTTVADIEVVRMVLSGTVNKRLVGQLLAAGVRAVGVSGEDGGLLSARVIDRAALGEVGEPARVDAAMLEALLDAAFVPVVSPLGRDADSGGTLNVNGDDAAAAIAAAMNARELLLIADVPGVVDDGAIRSRLDGDAARALMASGAASGGMIAKLEAAFRALEAGVPVVRIGDVGAITNPARGTRLTLSPSTV